MEKQEQTLFNDLRHMEEEVAKNIYAHGLQRTILVPGIIVKRF